MKNKTSISNANNFEEIGKFWDEHSLGDYEEQTKEVKFKVDLLEIKKYIAIEDNISESITKTAYKKGVSTETLINLWLQEKLLTLNSNIVQ
jgi:hypothetical protein